MPLGLLYLLQKGDGALPNENNSDSFGDQQGRQASSGFTKGTIQYSNLAGCQSDSIPG